MKADQEGKRIELMGAPQLLESLGPAPEYVEQLTIPLVRRRLAGIELDRAQERLLCLEPRELAAVDHRLRDMRFRRGGI